MTSPLLLVEETTVPGENHRLTPNHWLLSHFPQLRFEPRQWWETASSRWQRLCVCVREREIPTFVYIFQMTLSYQYLFFIMILQSSAHGQWPMRLDWGFSFVSISTPLVISQWDRNPKPGRNFFLLTISLSVASWSDPPPPPKKKKKKWKNPPWPGHPANEYPVTNDCSSIAPIIAYALTYIHIQKYLES